MPAGRQAVTSFTPVLLIANILCCLLVIFFHKSAVPVVNAFLSDILPLFLAVLLQLRRISCSSEDENHNMHIGLTNLVNGRPVDSFCHLK